MSNIRIILNNTLDNCNLIDEDPTKALTSINNIKDIGRSRIYRVDPNIGQTDKLIVRGIMVDQANTEITPAFCNSIALSRFVAKTSAEYTLKLYDARGNLATWNSTTSWPSGDLSGDLVLTRSGVIQEPIPWGNFYWGLESWAEPYLPSFSGTLFIDWFSTTPFSAFELEIYDINNTGDNIELGQIIMGMYFSPTYNIKRGHTIKWSEDTKHYRTQSGTLRANVATPYRELSLDLSVMTEADRIFLTDYFYNIGKRKELVVSLFPEDESLRKRGDYSMIAKFNDVPEYNEFAYGYYSTQLRLVEA